MKLHKDKSQTVDFGRSDVGSDDGDDVGDCDADEDGDGNPRWERVLT